LIGFEILVDGPSLQLFLIRSNASERGG